MDDQRVRQEIEQQAEAFVADHPGSRYEISGDGDEVTLTLLSADFAGQDIATRRLAVERYVEALSPDAAARLADLRLMSHLERIHQRQIIVTGRDLEGRKVDVTVGDLAAIMDFSYQSESDTMTMRLKSFEGEVVREDTDDGFVLLRNPATGAAVGMEVPNYMKRFGVQQLTADTDDDVGFIAPIVRSFLHRAA